MIVSGVAVSQCDYIVSQSPWESLGHFFTVDEQDHCPWDLRSPVSSATFELASVLCHSHLHNLGQTQTLGLPVLVRADSVLCNGKTFWVNVKGWPRVVCCTFICRMIICKKDDLNREICCPQYVVLSPSPPMSLTPIPSNTVPALQLCALHKNIISVKAQVQNANQGARSKVAIKQIGT